MLSDFLPGLTSFIQRLNLPYLFAVFSTFLVIERFFFAEKNQSFRGISFNARYSVLYFGVAVLLQPVIGYVTALAIARAGGGWIDLGRFFESEAPGGAVQGLTYLFIFDFFYYWFHRFQHTVPVLWSQHKLHHSDMEVNVTTTHRHHWLEEPLRMIFILIPMGIVFRIEPVTGGAIGMILGLWGFFIHSNLRLNLAFLTPMLGGPQAHRIHHSILPEHANKNYAALFPLFDVLFGTFVRPKRSEFPATGLHTGETVSTLTEASLWPFREWSRFSRLRFVDFAALAALTVICFGSGALYFSRTSEPAALQLPEYRMGETIAFVENAPSVRYLQRGWSTPEAGHTWMDGTVAELSIPMSRIPPGLKASFLVRAFIEPQKLPKQRYRIFLEGDKLAESEISSQEPVRIDLDIDTAGTTGILRFVLEAPDAAVPKDLGIGLDGRRLGLALLNVQLSDGEK